MGLRRIAACAVALLLVLLGAMPAAQAHESRPAYLEIRESKPGQYTVLWRTPVLLGETLDFLETGDDRRPDGVVDFPSPERGGGPHNGRQFFRDPGGGWPLGRPGWTAW